MKLVDKIQQASGIKMSDYSKIYYPTAEAIEKIADEFAIEFADWVNVNAYKYPTKITTKELLEIFKKERGL